MYVDSRQYEHTPQLFHMSSSSAVFDVSEILNPSRTEDDDIFTLMPFLQEDLYTASQPGPLHFTLLQSYYINNAYTVDALFVLYRTENGLGLFQSTSSVT